MLHSMSIKFRNIRIGAAAALLAAGITLSGCVVYPDQYAYNSYGYGYAPAYAPPVYVAPPVVSGTFFFGGGGGCCWRHWR